MTKTEIADLNHQKGYNCAQSVACAFAEDVGTDESTLMKMTEAFGAGCGGMQGMCGALSGALLLCGFVTSDGNTEHPSSKRTTYAAASKLCDEFRKECGSLICAEIKGIGGKQLASCRKCIEVGAKLTEKYTLGK